MLLCHFHVSVPLCQSESLEAMCRYVRLSYNRYSSTEVTFLPCCLQKYGRTIPAGWKYSLHREPKNRRFLHRNVTSLQVRRRLHSADSSLFHLHSRLLFRPSGDHLCTHHRSTS